MSTVGQEGRNTPQGGCVLPSLSFLETGSHMSQAGLTLAWLRHVLMCRKAQLHFCAVPGIDPGFVRELYHGICMA